jgi:hypothetical protein
VCLGSFLVAVCGGRNTGPPTITREVEAQLAAARDATIPGGIHLLHNSGPTREGQSVSAEWSFEAPVDWRRYLEQTEAALRRAGYEPRTASGDERGFNKRAPGDAYRVHVARDATGPRRVRVTFWASPD